MAVAKSIYLIQYYLVITYTYTDNAKSNIFLLGSYYYYTKNTFTRCKHIIEHCADLKKTGSRSFLVTAVLDVRVFRQVIDVLDWSVHTSAGNRRGQVGGVRRGHDQREKPPHPCH